MKTKSKKTLQLLRAYESRNVTYIDEDGSWPIVWERAKGVHVWDADGKKYLDLTAAFGVAAAGHANPNVVKAGQRQMSTLLHAMGDVHPHARKAELARELSRITFERWSAGTGKTIFCNSGFEAVEAAFKTAMLATGRNGIIAFEGGYHGLGYGALNATHREHFRAAFRRQLGGFTQFVPHPKTSTDLGPIETLIGKILQQKKVGGILVEPIQARGGINVPPPAFLRLLRKLCDRHNTLLIVDEIYTGFGRTGKWFACEHSKVAPDLICLGKALSGGFPISACIGESKLMDRAWPRSSGEAIHTSTFLGHPVGCAMALAQIKEVQPLIARSAKLGTFLLQQLKALRSGKLSITARGVGLMAGVELQKPDCTPATEESLYLIKALLHQGFVILPEGEHANVVSFTPPLTISEVQLNASVRALAELLQKA